MGVDQCNPGKTLPWHFEVIQKLTLIKWRHHPITPGKVKWIIAHAPSLKKRTSHQVFIYVLRGKATIVPSLAQVWRVKRTLLVWKIPEQQKGDFIHSKDPEVRESIGWVVEGAEKNYFDGLQLTQSKNMKIPIVEEWKIVTTDLPKYPDIEKWFNEYGLSYLSTPPGSYYPIFVKEFFSNYLDVQEKDWPKGKKASNMQNRTIIPVRGVSMDISDQTINRILFGQLYASSTITL